MDTYRFDRLVRRLPNISRRGALAALPMVAHELWRTGNDLLGAEAGSCKQSKGKKFNKKRSAICYAGETLYAGTKQRCQLLKKGATGGACVV